MKNKFYNLYVPLRKKKLNKHLSRLHELGYSVFALVLHDLMDTKFIEMNDIYAMCNEIGVECYLRIHITSNLIYGSSDMKNYKKLIFRLRNSFSKKGYIVSIDDSLLSSFTPNETLKFDIITISNPLFRRIIKLIDKPILFEYIPRERVLTESWLKHKLYILRLLLNREKLLISQNPYEYPVFPPSQISFFIYGLAGYENMSYNVVSTLPMQVINRCR